MGTIDLTNKIVKCRKPHRCGWCGENINIGEPAYYRAGVHDGDFFAEHQHIECWESLKNSDFGYDDEYYPMEQKRGKTYDESHA